MPTRKLKAKFTRPLLPGATERYLNYQRLHDSQHPLIRRWLQFKNRHLSRWSLLIQALFSLLIGMIVVYLLAFTLYDGPVMQTLNDWLQKSPLAGPIQRINQLGEQLTQGSKDIVLRDNMERVRLMVETFPTGEQKIYPQNLEQLYQDATTDNYWNLYKNPLTGARHPASVIADYSDYLYSGNKQKFAGMVLYESVSRSVYRIYGCDKEGKIIQKNGRHFYLSNL